MVFKAVCGTDRAVENGQGQVRANTKPIRIYSQDLYLEAPLSGRKVFHPFQSQGSMPLQARPSRSLKHRKPFKHIVRFAESTTFFGLKIRICSATLMIEGKMMR